MFCFCIAQADYYTTIKTPTNVSIEAIYCYEFSPTQLAHIEALAADWIDDNNSEAVRVAPASHTYNCHNFAWHYSDGGSARWVNELDQYSQANLLKYWSGASPTFQSTTSMKGTKVYYSSGDHSAKIISTSSYESKWGNWPRYQHSPSDCPYTSSNLLYYSVPVSGDALICSSKTYSVLNISGATYSWTGNNVSISGSGYSVTATKNGDGDGWIKTQVTSPYSGTTVLSETQSLWLGIPDAPEFSPPTPIYIPIGDERVTIYVSNIGISGPITAYSWSYRGPSIIRHSDPDDSYFQVSAISLGIAKFACSISNSCGTSEPGQGWLIPFYWEEKMSYPLIIYPNPATTYIIVTFDAEKLNVPIEDFLSAVASSKKQNFFRVIDMYGEVYLTQMYYGTLETTIDVSKLKEGVYYLQLILDEEVHQVTFLISR